MKRNNPFLQKQANNNFDVDLSKVDINDPSTIDAAINIPQLPAQGYLSEDYPEYLAANAPMSIDNPLESFANNGFGSDQPGLELNRAMYGVGALGVGGLGLGLMHARRARANKAARRAISNAVSAVKPHGILNNLLHTPKGRATLGTLAAGGLAGYLGSKLLS